MIVLGDIAWKKVLLILAACYAAPWTLIAVTLFLLFPEGSENVHWKIALAGAIIATTTCLSPAAAGYFAAKLVSRKPRFNAMLVVALGIGANIALFDYPLDSQLFQAVISLVLGFLGTFLALRGQRREA